MWASLLTTSLGNTRFARTNPGEIPCYGAIGALSAKESRTPSRHRHPAAPPSFSNPFEDRVDAEAVGELPYALDCLVALLAHDV
jgi:hypothetical protein